MEADQYQVERNDKFALDLYRQFIEAEANIPPGIFLTIMTPIQIYFIYLINAENEIPIAGAQFSMLNKLREQIQEFVVKNLDLLFDQRSISINSHWFDKQLSGIEDFISLYQACRLQWEVSQHQIVTFTNLNIDSSCFQLICDQNIKLLSNFIMHKFLVKLSYLEEVDISELAIIIKTCYCLFVRLLISVKLTHKNPKYLLDPLALIKDTLGEDMNEHREMIVENSKFFSIQVHYLLKIVLNLPSQSKENFC